MVRKKTALKTVLKRFPEQTFLIKELYEKSDSFRSICEDYTDCVEIINRIECSKQMVKKGYIKEYEALLHELEEELIEKLDKKKTEHGKEKNIPP